jgi:uncharacterized protein (DUF3084 family)
MSAPVNDDSGKRLTGEAAWRAHRDAIDQRNAAVRRAAKQMTAADSALVARERRLQVIENQQISKLNPEG